MILYLLNLLTLLKPTPENNTLLNDHDGFLLKPKKLVKNYQGNRTDPKTQHVMFLHMTNHDTTDHSVASNRKNGHFVHI